MFYSFFVKRTINLYTLIYIMKNSVHSNFLGTKKTKKIQIVNILVTAHRWFSCSSTGLSNGRSLVQLWPDQHTGSLHNRGESADFVITSANG